MTAGIVIAELGGVEFMRKADAVTEFRELEIRGAK